MKNNSSFRSTGSAGGGTGEESGSGSFNLRNLSKIILPPLGGTPGQSQSHGGSSDKWVISPLDSRYRWWDTLMVVMVAYSAWVYPFEVAFMNASHKGGLEVADIVVDLFFAVDIVLTFFVAYIDPRTQLLVHDRKKITFRYVSGQLPCTQYTCTMPFALPHLSALQTCSCNVIVVGNRYSSVLAWLHCMSGKKTSMNHL